MNKYQWTVVAKDFNSPFIRNYIWTTASYRFQTLFGFARSWGSVFSIENHIEYLVDMSTWQAAHDDIIKKVDEDVNFVDKLIDATNKYGEDFNSWSEQNIFKAELSKASNDTLISLLKEFVERQSTLYAHGIILPTLDFANFSYVEGNLKKFLKEKSKDEKEYSKYYDLFTKPLNNSFALDQEEDLLRLMIKFYDISNWISDIKSKTLTEIKASYPDFFENLSKHTAKHSWVYYVYAGPAFTEKHFLDFIKDYLNKNINPSKKLEELNSKRLETNKLRELYIKELQPDSFNEMIIRLTGKMVWAKPRRKDYQSRSYYHFEKLLREIARRLSISLSQARSAPVELIEEGLKIGKIDIAILNSIYKCHICLPTDSGGVKVLFGKEALDFHKQNVKPEDEQDLTGIKELKGTVAQPGMAKGLVKIINTPEDLDKMNEGDILVSEATTPSVVPAMKKAGAIVTNEGGLTCHAAIVSRELGIPCVIGTKIATKVLKDGDMVGVDAERGVVKIIK